MPRLRITRVSATGAAGDATTVIVSVVEDYFADISVQMFSYSFFGFPEWWGS